MPTKPATKAATKSGTVRKSATRPTPPVKKTSAPAARPRRAVSQQRSHLEATLPVTPPAPPAPPLVVPPAAWNAPVPVPAPGFFARRGVQFTAVGISSLIVGLVIGAAGAGASSAGHSNATDTAAATATKQQPSTPSTTKSHASTPAKHTAAPKAHTAAPAAPRTHAAAAPTKPNDKGWVVQSLSVKNDGLEDFGGSARVTNTNAASKTVVVTFTLFRNGHQIGVLEGTADEVAAGKTVTVDLVSEDPYSAGSFTYDFQADVSF